MSVWKLAQNQQLDLTSSFFIMGILNVTPDSFSDGNQNFLPEQAIVKFTTMVEQGAAIIDIGAESTRPKADPIPASLEQQRLAPVLLKAKKDFNVLISIDTYHAQTAKFALHNGAHIINDVWGLQKEPEIAELVAHYKAGIIIMHTNRTAVVLDNIFEDQKYFFDKSLNIASKAGIKESQIVLDPGFGFGKTPQHSLGLLKGAAHLKQFGFPLLAATSRKAFLGHIGQQASPQERDALTVASSVILRQAGFSIFRVHNVKDNLEALRLCDACLPNKS